MKERIDKKIIIGFLSGLVLATIIFGTIELLKISQVDVILEFEWLEENLDLQNDDIVKLNDLSTITISFLPQIYPDLILYKVYINKDKVLEAFRFQINSGYLGIATVEYDENERVKIINFYNQFDLSLKNYLHPSHVVKVFYNTACGNLVYDGFCQNLFSLIDGDLSIFK